jgi:hypothetical protein
VVIGQRRTVICTKGLVDLKSVEVLQRRATTIRPDDVLAIVRVAVGESPRDLLDSPAERIVREPSLFDAVLLDLGELVLGVPGVGPGVCSFDFGVEISVWINGNLVGVRR